MWLYSYVAGFKSVSPPNLGISHPVSAGSDDAVAGGGISLAVQQRDASLHAWFDSHIHACLSDSDCRQEAVELARQLCASQVAVDCIH